MPDVFPRSAELRAANPVLGSNRLKLGVFGINWVGLSMSQMPGTLVPTWESSLEVGRLADRAGLEAIVPVSRWKSMVPGKPGHRTSQALECFTWAAAMAMGTERAAIFSTCHVAAFPPVLAAKQASTVDQISGGRFGLNVVAGWNATEPAMFGAEMFVDHERRYGQAAEWMEIVERVWTSEVEFDFHGDFYDVEGAYTEPRPAQAPRPIVMNAGLSGHGRDFAARWSDMMFVTIQGDDPALASGIVAEHRAHARATAGREPGVWMHGYVVHGETDAEAHALADEIYASGDLEWADAFIAGIVATNSGLPADVHAALRRQIVLGSGGFPLIGSSATIADRLQTLSDCGVDGVLLTWVDYAAGIRHLADEILPLLEERGLRAPAPQLASAR